MVATVAAGGAPDVVSVYKVGFPEPGLCGQQDNVTESPAGAQWRFLTKTVGMREGGCADVGYARYVRTSAVTVQGHELSVGVYAPTQTPTTDLAIEDLARGGRRVRMKLCAPLGNASRYPLYVFGHGAGCDAEDYTYFCRVAAVASVYHETPLGPLFPADFDTAAAAADAALVAARLPELAKDPGSALHGKLDGTFILGGHSMGGGTTVLAAGGEAGAPARVAGVALYAPGLYTMPNATPFLRNVTVPALVVSGSNDCGQNALEKQAQPAYDGISSVDKVLVVVRGANHCQWTQPFERFLGICSTFSRHECHGISRSAQHVAGQRLFATFARAVGGQDGWRELERVLAAGEAEGAWTFKSSRSSPSRRLRSDCPCEGGAEAPPPLVV